LEYFVWDYYKPYVHWHFFLSTILLKTTCIKAGEIIDALMRVRIAEILGYFAGRDFDLFQAMEINEYPKRCLKPGEERPRCLSCAIDWFMYSLEILLKIGSLPLWANNAHVNLSPDFILRIRPEKHNSIAGVD
jgi:hypothetical protein